MSKEISARPLHPMAHAYSSLSYADFQKPESVCLLLQYLLQSCSREEGVVEDMCYERRRAEACVD